MSVVSRSVATVISIVLIAMCMLLGQSAAILADDAELSHRELPAWYQDAKLGIFIHWGLYSVPAFAQGKMTIKELTETLDFEGWLADMPYAAWYLNSMKIESSPTHEHHINTYGADFPYENFATQFNESIQQWESESWASLFKEAGAKYMILTTKHHDGFLLWPSETPNPFKENYHASRDLVGELTEAVRDQGLKMGLYYSSGLDWTFNPAPIKDMLSFFGAIPQQQEYVDYVDAHWRELIRRYHPDVLWADIGSPNAFDALALVEHYYSQIPDGVVNDRHRSKIAPEGIVSGIHHDFTTPEYTSPPDIVEKKWESTRGIGRAFAYNRVEDVKDYLTVDQLVDMLVDVVSKNGNLLLGVGPHADGSIPAEQRKRLLGLGAWLKVNGEAIYGSRYWDRAEGTTLGGTSIRFTKNNGNLYAILLERPKNMITVLENLGLKPDSEIWLLGTKEKLTWEQQGENLSVQFPEDYPESEAYVLRINNQSQ